MGNSIAIHNLPPVVLGAVAVTYDAVMGIACAGIELDGIAQIHPECLMICAVRHRAGLTVSILGDELFAIKQVYLGFIVWVIARHTPSGVEGDA